MKLLKTLMTCSVALLLLTSCIDANSPSADWPLFKQCFVQPEGRVVDDVNAAVSHTEGQGVTMLLAVHYGDRETFDRVWRWTRKNLQVRDDKLLAWRWSSSEGVADKNNASDGDIFVAWALLRAADKWRNPDYRYPAMEILGEIRQKLLRKTSHGVILQPGVVGFDKPEGAVVNLSYWIFPALPEIAKADPSPLWRELQETGIRLLKEGRFGRWGLPADWMILGGGLVPGAPPRFGYDAVRIPLYLIWGRVDTAELMSAYQNYWRHFRGVDFVPAWTDLSDDTFGAYNSSQGIQSIAKIAMDYPDPHAVILPALDCKQGYYSSILLLLTKLALTERAL